MSADGFRALVLAGSRDEVDPFAAQAGAAHKALIILQGKTLLARVVGALKQAGAAKIVVSCAPQGPVADEARALGCAVAAQASGPSRSVAEVFAEIGAPLLVTTADHALLEAKWVTEMIAATPPAADLSVMMAEQAKIEQALPGSKRTYLRFADGRWSGCNLFYLQKPEANRAMQAWQEIEADRKRPWRIARKLGAAVLVNYALGRLTMAGALHRLGERFDLDAALVAASDGRAAIDVDKMQDLDDIRAMLGEG